MAARTRTAAATTERREAAHARMTALMDQLAAFEDELDEDELALAKIAIWAQHYSERNAMLIVMQRPEATEIRGYRDWQAHGRQVRKGEHGIAILAPAGQSDEQPATDGEAAKPGRKFFRLVSVFDLAQTDPIEESA